MSYTSTIQPIDTIYNNRRFRSRLEARWAVFFDRLNIPYEYEFEGYMLPGNKMYLPDFYLFADSLPYGNFYVEIKPVVEDNPKCRLLGVNGDYPVILVGGSPLQYFCELYAPDAIREKAQRDGGDYLRYIMSLDVQPLNVNYLTIFMFNMAALIEKTHALTIPLNNRDILLYPEAHDLPGDEVIKYIDTRMHEMCINKPLAVAVEAAMQERF